MEIIMRKFVSLSLVALTLGSAAIAAPTHFNGAKLLPMAKISLVQARKTALAAHPGVITDQELEKEGGGTGLRYSFDIKANGKTFEVGVDGRTGKVLENKAEGPNPD
ncbi:PepSY domain-containing protein [Sphingomonas sp. RB1R13]|uniref:PepSY domain-containing protein n=1 Tax=Sphingomonas sp. RB1R13 TaxID=3096159 RepID=UPI002FC5C203